MSQNNRKHDQSKKKQPSPVQNNIKNAKKSTESKKKNVISEKQQQQQHNRNSKSNVVLGDLKAQINYDTLVKQTIDMENGDSPVLSPATGTDHNMQIAIQKSIHDQSMLIMASDDLEEEFFDISSDEDDDHSDSSSKEENEDIENWELMDESSHCLVNLNKPYNFSDMEFPVLKKCNSQPKSNIQNQTNNPWLNSKVLIKSISQQS
ncbi:hypothetical protein DLAC_10647 [Tieghemostelium lacteum]|uniref:Uncharacterized protein n=1 Tax=Tieghemostelium lacteum TaxID=361077 RepID=A0A151Z4H4_TIELA|nr:hypothetical protein DLAC_10647 [Tieghemostelium lacteum]|eukprot:KYQ88845.1 hypothetical protein DLAC_10647 [Tieghemostelium lacteum]